ncbi:MAG: hydrolase family protein [Herbinix sp.]|jgi:lysophospholipase L1-like esterase|nr:hydrolase family protein [Herbinix sp.]
MSSLLKLKMEQWRKETNRAIKIMTFGASESHFASHSHARPTWFQWFEKSLRCNGGPHFITINCGINGNSVVELCERFDRDVLSFRPDVVIITMGGNDAKKIVPADEFEEKLSYLCERVKSIGGIPVLQTLYSPVMHDYPKDYNERFPCYMQLNKKVAEAQKIPLIDSYRIFGSYYCAEPEEYTKTIMTDDIHVNPIGNAVWGTFAAREFGLPDPDLDELKEPVYEVIERLKVFAEVPEKITTYY